MPQGRIGWGCICCSQGILWKVFNILTGNNEYNHRIIWKWIQLSKSLIYFAYLTSHQCHSSPQIVSNSGDSIIKYDTPNLLTSISEWYVHFLQDMLICSDATYISIRVMFPHEYTIFLVHLCTSHTPRQIKLIWSIVSLIMWDLRVVGPDVGCNHLKIKPQLQKVHGHESWEKCTQTVTVHTCHANRLRFTHITKLRLFWHACKINTWIKSASHWVFTAIW